MNKSGSDWIETKRPELGTCERQSKCVCAPNACTFIINHKWQMVIGFQSDVNLYMCMVFYLIAHHHGSRLCCFLSEQTRRTELREFNQYHHRTEQKEHAKQGKLSISVHESHFLSIFKKLFDLDFIQNGVCENACTANVPQKWNLLVFSCGQQNLMNT